MVTPPPKKGNSSKVFRIILFFGIFVLLFMNMAQFIYDYTSIYSHMITPDWSEIFAKHLFNVLIGIFIVVCLALGIKLLYMIATEELKFDKLMKKGWRSLTED